MCEKRLMKTGWTLTVYIFFIVMMGEAKASAVSA